MKTYPARFVGEFTKETRPLVGDLVKEIGDVAVLRGFAQWSFVDVAPDATYLQIKCACGSVDEVALAPMVQRYNGASWTITSRDPVHINPSVVSTVGPWTDDAGVEHTKRCHYFVHNGELQMLDDTTAPLP